MVPNLDNVDEAQDQTAFLPPFDVVAIAASSGGVQAVSALLSELPPDFPAAILLVQHLPSAETVSSNLDMVLSWRSAIPVRWAEPGRLLAPGVVLLAPQDRHLSVAESPEGTRIVRLSSEPKINRVRPAADPLFWSVARHYEERAIAVVLSGMLNDGAEGTRAIFDRGGRVLVQDRATSHSFGMPGAALATGAVDFALSPKMLAHALTTLVMAPGGADWFSVGHYWRGLQK